MTKQPFRLVACCIGSIAHILAYVQFVLSKDRLLLYETITDQFNIIISISLIAVILLPFLKNKYYIWLIIIFRGLLCLIISIMLNGYIGLELILIADLIFELFIYTSLAGGLIFSVLLVAVTTFFQQIEISVFKNIFPKVSLQDTLAFCAYVSLIMILSLLAKYRQISETSLKELNNKLNKATLELADANVRLQEYAIKVERETANNERRMVAQEVHDFIAYTLTNIIMMAEAGVVINGSGNEGLTQQLKKIREQAKEGLDEARKALKTIRTPVNNNMSGLKTVKRLVDSFMEATKIKIHLDFSNVPLYFDKRIEKTVYRLVQEGLTNAIRHGQADEIHILFSQKEEMLFINIKDNGVGCKEITEGFGLMGIRERISDLGGGVEVKTEIGKGYMLRVWIPLRGDELDGDDKSFVS